MAPIFAAIAPIVGFITANIGTIGTVMSVASAGLGAAGTLAAGAQAQEAAKLQAKEMQKKGEQEYAIAQRRAAESRKQKRSALGRTLAVAAASGGGTGDTVTDIMTGIEQRGEYNALTDMFNGAVARNDLYTDAFNTKEQGKSVKRASRIEAGSSLLSAAGTIYGDYSQRKRAKKAHDYAMEN
jgi:hypothetical protein